MDPVSFDANWLRDCFLLRPDVVFLNHGSFGACPRPVFEVYQGWQVELERQPVEFLGRRFGSLMRRAREGLSAYVGADPDDLVYVSNATFGVNLVARSLPLAAGDEVLTTDHEYGAMERAWRFVCAKRKANLVKQELPLPVESQQQLVEAVWSGVTDRTRVLFISHITSPTALRMPIVALVRRAREAGIITVIDGAHGPGQVPLRLAELGSDFYIGNCHKWMMAPKGAAFLHARREHQPLLEPLIISWGWQAENPGPSRFVDENEYQGTRDVAAFLSVPAAIGFMREHNWEEVQNACSGLVGLARRQITELTGLPPLTPDGSDWRGQMASFPLPLCDGEAFQRRLHDQFAIEIPVVTLNHKQYIRISVQGYNTRTDVETLVEALGHLLPDLDGQ